MTGGCICVSFEFSAAILEKGLLYVFGSLFCSSCSSCILLILHHRFEMVFDLKLSLTRLLRLHAHLTEPPNFHFNLLKSKTNLPQAIACVFSPILPVSTTHTCISSLTDSLSCIFSSWFSFVSHSGLSERGTYS